MKMSPKATARFIKSLLGNARILDQAIGKDNAFIMDEAMVYESATIYGQAAAGENSHIYGLAKVGGWSRLLGNTRVFDQADVIDTPLTNCVVCGDVQVRGYGALQDVYWWKNIP